MTEEVEFGAAVHGSFEQFQLCDLALSLTIAPRHDECGTHGIAILGQSFGESLDGPDAARCRISDPAIERASGICPPLIALEAAGSDQIDKAADEVADLRRFGVLLESGDCCGFI